MRDIGLPKNVAELVTRNPSNLADYDVLELLSKKGDCFIENHFNFFVSIRGIEKRMTAMREVLKMLEIPMV